MDENNDGDLAEQLFYDIVREYVVSKFLVKRSNWDFICFATRLHSDTDRLRT